MKALITAMLVSLFALAPAMAALIAQPIGKRLDHPWGMALLSADEVLVTIRPGKMYRISLTSGQTDYIQNTPKVAHWGQGGLLDVAVHGDDIYLCYAKKVGSGAATAIDKARLLDTQLIGRMTIFTSNLAPASAHHFGCRLGLHDGHLYATIGDRGERWHAQDAGHHNGSVIRLNLDGTVPANNPHKQGWQPEIFTIGHRNPQGLAIHPVTGAIWTHEHGPQGGDEINILEAGGNYGWPAVSFGEEYGTSTPVSARTSHPDMVDPRWVWVPSIAPSGMAFYPSEGAMFPDLQGSLLIGSLKFKQLYQIRLDEAGLPASEQVIMDKMLGRIRDVAVAPDGALLILTDAPAKASPAGGLYRLTPGP